MPLLKRILKGEKMGFRELSSAKQAIYLLQKGKPSPARKKAAGVRKQEKRANHRESTAALIMKASDTMNESFRLGFAKGPHCIAVHQTTNAEMISATVAVSRGPWRSEAHSNGRMTTKISAS